MTKITNEDFDSSDIERIESILKDNPSNFDSEVILAYDRMGLTIYVFKNGKYKNESSCAHVSFEYARYYLVNFNDPLIITNIPKKLKDC